MELLYKKYKRRKVGPCNICGQLGPLSWDHVPPKGGIELQPVEIDRIAGTLVSSLGSKKPEISHDGLKFRTLCSTCNSRLGTDYDPALNDFAITVGRFLRSTFEFPDIVHIEAKPTAIARAILGHLLTARLSTVDAVFDPVIRALVLDPQAPIPTKLNVFYWVHPYAQQIVFRDGLMPAKRGKYSEIQRFGVLKYFPIGYLVTDVCEYEGLEALTVWRNEPATQTVQVPVRLHKVHDAFWPEATAPDNFLLIGQGGLESVCANPKKRRWK